MLVNLENLLGVIRINFNEFKNKDKLNLEKDIAGNYKASDKVLTDCYLEDKKDPNLKIVLTKVELQDGDYVTITNYDPDGDIESSVFKINHFCHVVNKYYEIKIEHMKEDLTIFSRILGRRDNKRYWRIEVCELCSKNGKTIRTCDVREIDTAESLEISLKLDSYDKSIKRKIFELLNSFKYDRLKLKIEQQPLFDISHDVVEVSIRREISAS